MIGGAAFLVLALAAAAGCAAEQARAADPFVSFVWFVVESLRRFPAPLMSDFNTKHTKKRRGRR